MNNMTHEQALELVMTHIADRVLVWALEGDWTDEQAKRTFRDIVGHPVCREWVEQQVEALTATRH